MNGPHAGRAGTGIGAGRGSKPPLVHCITNYVTAQRVADAVLSAGGSPVMADDPLEAADIAARADALLLNLGTPSESRIEAMIAAGRIANRRGIPVVLDPVGCGMSDFRITALRAVLAAVRPSIIRGNASEMLACARLERTESHGVDAAAEHFVGEENLERWVETASEIAARYRCRAIITGAVDIDAVFDVGTETVSVSMRPNPPRVSKRRSGEGCVLAAELAAEEARRSRTGINPYLLYGVTPAFSGHASEAEYLSKIEAALESGITMLQFREKEAAGERLADLAIRVRELCRRYGVPFIVNDSIELAAAADADGVHLGQSDGSVEEARRKLPGRIVGRTAHSYAEAVEAQREGADYIGVGAVFATRSKKDAPAMLLETLTKIRNNVRIPVIAIGGITCENAAQLAETGIDGVAVISGIFGAADIRSEVSTLLGILAPMQRSSDRIRSLRLPRCLTIAGSDSSGGAGIQADLKTFAACGTYGMSVLTAITAQNTTGVRAVHDIPPEIVAAQLDAVFEDIEPDAVKIGMVSSAEIIRVIASKLRSYRPRAVVLDPVMVATSGSSLISEDALDVLIRELIPLASVVTPNVPEAEMLLAANTGAPPASGCGRSGFPDGRITDAAGLRRAAEALGERFGVPFLVKGGHLEGKKADVLADRGSTREYAESPIDNPNTHGTGCTLSSAIAAALARGESLPEAAASAKAYVRAAIARKLNIGAGRGPLDHGA